VLLVRCDALAPDTGQQQIAAVLDENKKLLQKSQKIQSELEKSSKAAAMVLEDALSGWMKFRPKGMSVETAARIQKAVLMYVTESDMRSLAKIAGEFKVSRKTVSGWFKKFTEVMGYPVITHKRNESVRSHSQGEGKGEEEEEEDEEPER
jgi:AraC-like DNA-binding protein